MASLKRKIIKYHISKSEYTIAEYYNYKSIRNIYKDNFTKEKISVLIIKSNVNMEIYNYQIANQK